jgi:monovalent cation:H+ antiporter, CPA1 family
MIIEPFGLLLLVAAVVAMLARRLQFPYTVGLLLAGVGLTLVPAMVPRIALTKNLIFFGLLPPLIFEAALFIHWKALKRVMPVVLVLATVGLVMAAAVTGAGMMWLLHWPVLPAALFGVLIAATDPVSVIATFKDVGLTGPLRVLVEAESLLNDGVAAVLFSLLLSVVTAGSFPGPLQVLGQLAWVSGVGLACGALVAGSVLYLVGKTEDHLVELTFTALAAYGSFLLAEHFHCSGVLATLAAGLIIGNWGLLGELSAKGREAVEAFWEFAAFVANSVVFILIGIHEAQQPFGALLVPSLVAIGLVLLGRVACVVPVAALFAGHPTLRVSGAYQQVLVWGGLRGALALALALGLPVTMPYREAIITLSFAVVAFSVVVQGLTMTPLMKRLGLL